MINVRSSTLKKYLSDSSLRLSLADREFLADMAVVRIIGIDDAAEHHYKNNRAPQKRLDRMCKAGLLEVRDVYQPGKGSFKAYSFASEKIARLFGGKIPSIGSRRNALHECITSKIYFAEGRPESFTLEADFSSDQKELIAVNEGASGENICMPDAMFMRNGKAVVVEADSGQYNQTQIQAKQSAWKGLEQVWGQPSKAAARVHGNSKVYRFA